MKKDQPFEKKNLYDVNVSYIIVTDFSDKGITQVNKYESTGIMELCNGIYKISKDEFITNGEEKPSICSLLRETYRERIKTKFLNNRNAVIYEIKSIHVKSILLRKENIFIPFHKDVKIVLELTELGLMLFHVIFPMKQNIPLQNCLCFKDPSQVYLEVDVEYKIGDGINLKGSYSVIDIINFISSIFITILLPSRKTKNALSIFKETKPRISVEQVHEKIKEINAKQFEAFNDYECYPMFFISLNDDIEGMNLFIQTNQKILRALVTEDKNWDKKTTKIISSMIPDRNFATRDTLAWYVYNIGSVKIFSNRFETGLIKSQILNHFELGIVLAIKYYLYRTIFRLTEAIEKKWTPRRLSSFRKEEYDKLQRYFDIDIACKDTTAKRINEFFDIFRINYALNNIKERFSYISEAISTKYQQQLSRSQMLLTLIFGVFGAGSISFTLLNMACDLQRNRYLVWPVIYEVIYVMGAIGVVLTYTIYVLRKV